MRDTRKQGTGQHISYRGAAIGAATACCCWRRLSGETHSPEIAPPGRRSRGLPLIDAGKELVDKCEDLYARSGEVVDDATHELSGKYHALSEYSKQLLDEAREAILRRTKSATFGR